MRSFASKVRVPKGESQRDCDVCNCAIPDRGDKVNEYSFGGDLPSVAVAALSSPRTSAVAITNNPLGLRQSTVAKRDPNHPDSTPASPASSANRNAEKYQRILDAAVAVFAEKGFFVSRISDIADRADVADGTVYLYFKNKDEILATAINTAFDGFMKTARTELERLADSDRATAATGFSSPGSDGIESQYGGGFPDGAAAEHAVSVGVFP